MPSLPWKADVKAAANSCTRRSFLASAAAFAMHNAAAQHPSLIGEPSAAFPTQPRARIAVASYPFRAMISAPGNKDLQPSAHPGMDLLAFARFVQRTFNIDRIEPLDNHFASTQLSDVRQLKAGLDAAGIAVVNIPVDEHVDLCSTDPGLRKQGNARYAHWIDIAKTLGSPSVRMSLPKCADTSDLQKAVDAFRPTIAYAASQKIVINLENDDPILASDSRLVSAINLAHTPWLRALPDFANSLMGGDENFNHQAVKNMFGHAFNLAHVKDAEIIDGKKRAVSLPALFALAKQTNYRGYYSMESDSNADPIADTRHLIEQALQLM